MPKLVNKTDFVVNNVLLGALIIMGAYFTTQSSAFLEWSNFELILTNNAALGVLCAAFALLVIAGAVDLSVGSTVGLAGLVSALAVTSWGLPTGAAFLIGTLVGTGVGCINGFLCGVFLFNPIIVTLGMLGVLRGSALIVHEQDINGLGGVFGTVANGHVLGIDVLLIIAVAAFALSAAFVAFTPAGRHLYAIGLNREAAYLSALPVRALPFCLYVVTGTAAGLAGVLISARLDGATAGSQGLTMELQALTVILLGGIAFAGGRGTIFGALIAWLFLGTLQNGLTLMNVTPYVQEVASGMALVIAAGLDRLGALLSPRLRQTVEVDERPPDGTRSSIHADVNDGDTGESQADVGPSRGVAKPLDEVRTDSA